MTDGSINIRRIADDVAMATVGDERSNHVASKFDPTSYVSNCLYAWINLIINQNRSQTEQLANQPRIDQRAIFAVVAPVEERLFDGHLFMASKKITIARELKSVLHQSQ